MEDLQTLRQTYIATDREIKELDEMVKDKKAFRQELKFKIIDAMAASGLAEMRDDTGVLFTCRPSVNVKMVDKSLVFEWLEQQGLFKDMATVNARTWSSFVKEMDANGEEIPPGTEVEEFMNLNVTNRGGNSE